MNKNYTWKTEPMDHQAEAFWWANHGGKAPTGSIGEPDAGYKQWFALFMEQGTGKSKTVLDIAVADYLAGRINTLLIIAPNDVHKQWYAEQLPLHVATPYIAGVYGGGINRAMQSRVQAILDGVVDDRLNILCVNVDTFSSPRNWIQFVDWVRNNKTFIVIDEATSIKNVTAKRTDRIMHGFCDCIWRGKTLKKATPFSVRRAILTGTPITNGPLDLYPMFEFLIPDYFKRSFYSYKLHFGLYYRKFISDKSQQSMGRNITIQIDREAWRQIRATRDFAEAAAMYGVSESAYATIKGQAEFEGAFRNLDELRELIRPTSFFKKKEDCLDLPEKIYKKRLLQMSPEQARIYNELQDQMITEFKGKTVTAINKLTLLVRLAQVASGFLPTQDIEIDSNGDVDITTEIHPIDKSNVKVNAILEDMAYSSFPALVVTRFTAEAMIMYTACQKAFPSAKVGLYVGTKKVPSDPIQAFKDGEVDILIANNRMIRMGWNLQVCSNTYIFTNDFSLETRLQFEDRTHRIGVTESPTYNDYIMLDTVDMKTYAALKQKKKLLDYIRETPIENILTEVDDSMQVEYKDILEGTVDVYM